MKRSEIEAKAREQLLKLKAGIEVQPLKAVGVALFAGILLAVFAKLGVLVEQLLAFDRVARAEERQQQVFFGLEVPLELS